MSTTTISKLSMSVLTQIHCDAVRVCLLSQWTQVPAFALQEFIFAAVGAMARQVKALSFMPADLGQTQLDADKCHVDSVTKWEVETGDWPGSSEAC